MNTSNVLTVLLDEGSHIAATRKRHRKPGFLVCLNNLYSLTDKTTGLGKVMTQALATNGASKIYILGRRKDRLEAAAREINPDVVVPIVADVASKESLVQAADTIRAEMGYVNILIANAGIVFSSPSPASSGSGLSGGGPIQIGRALKNNPTPAELESYLIETPEAEFRDTYMINSAGVFYSIAAFVSLLHAGNEKKTVSQKSQVVAVASVAGQHRYATGGCAYGMSKAAVITLMKQMMTYLVPLNIRANTISPGGEF
jgi:NAD(P)-dependent dehydrogenase (short-subunit alcohol dehydrogenase family)